MKILFLFEVKIFCFLCELINSEDMELLRLIRLSLISE